jgi:hypothetical protein
MSTEGWNGANRCSKCLVGQIKQENRATENGIVSLWHCDHCGYVFAASMEPYEHSDVPKERGKDGS